MTAVQNIGDAVQCIVGAICCCCISGPVLISAPLPDAAHLQMQRPSSVVQSMHLTTSHVHALSATMCLRTATRDALGAEAGATWCSHRHCVHRFSVQRRPWCQDRCAPNGRHPAHLISHWCPRGLPQTSSNDPASCGSAALRWSITSCYWLACCPARCFNVPCR
jgi:hypothetical protein